MIGTRREKKVYEKALNAGKENEDKGANNDPLPGESQMDALCNRTGSSIVNLKAILFIACFKLAPSFFSHSLYKHLLLMGHV